MPRIRAITRKDSGMPLLPVTANIVVTPPPSTVSGADAATTKKNRCTTPRRRLARVPASCSDTGGFLDSEVFDRFRDARSYGPHGHHSRLWRVPYRRITTVECRSRSAYSLPRTIGAPFPAGPSPRLFDSRLRL